ncbi:MAG: biopolymer transporter ExbD [Deltaproteobacteria bacterium]|nr:MAG: biopolymer transporter ExbD [Deltaproteobacteria bacterium]
MGMAAGGKGLRAEINVTPLVDVVLVLLIIFMVITPMLQKGKAVQLPRTDNHEKGAGSEDQLIVALVWDRNDEDGKIFVQREKEPISPEELKTLVKENPRKPIYLKIDIRHKFKAARKIMDILSKAGAKSVGLAIEVKKNQNQ